MAASSGPAASQHELRTVLVDDAEEMRDLLRALLGRDGRFVVVGEAGDGAEASRVVGEVRPDLVVLDIHMPSVDGLAALPRLREASPATRIVMLSGFPADEMERPALEAGAIGYIEKGGDPALLASQLHALASVLDAVQQVLDRTYDADVASPRRARADLRAVLRDGVAPSAVEIVELLTTELVTNAVLHARSAARVAAEVRAERIRVSVTDDGPGTPAVPGSGDDAPAEGGRGLAMVAALSRAWGVARGATTKTVWFEVDA